jgi:hypothetical protein
MIGSARARRSLTASQPQKSNVHRYPAPMGGVDVRLAIGSEDLNHCIYTYNMVPYEFGMQVRHGYREIQIGYDNGFGLGIRTLIPFDSALEASAGDALYVVTNEGIWNPAIEDAVPTLAVVFGITDGNAGYGTYAHYITDAGIDIVYYADAVNVSAQRYVPGSTEVFVSGMLSSINQMNGTAQMGDLTIDYTPSLGRDFAPSGEMWAFRGTRPSLDGAMISDRTGRR